MDLKKLTLLIPAKYEKESLPIVLKSLENFNCKKLIVMSSDDFETINSIKEYECDILFQKKSGYGNAIIEGINNIKTEYMCIFNADGSFDHNDLEKMYFLAISKNLDFIFASRYSGKNSGSEDDSLITYIGNKIFSFLGNFLFRLNLKDILYTYVLGKTSSFKLCNLNCGDFRICVEFPINLKQLGFIYNSYSSFERKRLFGKKKVNEIKDGFLILYYMIYRFFKQAR
jgi:glycosyltransferase involved in cell wall biosynthesis